MSQMLSLSRVFPGKMVDPQQPLVDVEALVARVDRSLGRARLSAPLMSVLGIVTLLLAAVGIYGATVRRARGGWPTGSLIFGHTWWPATIP
jgi:hypothetical protein